VVFDIPSAVAVIVTGFPLLSDTPVTTPETGSTEAIVGSEEDQTALVNVCVVLSL
jgi:hypothetical protein